MSKRPKITMYCTCGGSIELTFVRGASLETRQRAASRVFRSAHAGDGHALCDAATAAKARDQIPTELPALEGDQL